LAPSSADLLKVKVIWRQEAQVILRVKISGVIIGGGGPLKILGFGFFTAPKEVRYNFGNLQFLHLIDLLSYSYFIEFKEHFHSCHYYPRH